MTSQPQHLGFIVIRTAVIAALATVLTLVQVRSSKGKEGAKGGVSAAQEPKWRFACPDYYVKIQFVATANGVDSVFDSVPGIPLSGPITNIPEYHDCQRFIDTTGLFYDSVYAIFAAFQLEASNAFTVKETPVATIYTPNGTYDALGIGSGFNCLLLKQVRLYWTAIMVHRGQGNQNSDCMRLPSTDGKRLQVRRQIVGGFGPNDYPPVARWDWDSAHSRQYIGIRCGAAWCEVGAPGFTPSAGYKGPDLAFDPVPGVPLLQTALRVQRIKGWYDAQRLELPGSTPQRPGSVHGFLFPNPVLDLINWQHQPVPMPFNQVNPVQYYTNRWVHVGNAVLDGDYKKWHFTRGQNKIFFCYGKVEPRGCPMPQPPPPNYASKHPPMNAVDDCPMDPHNQETRWSSMIVSAAGDTTYGCVRRMDHLGELTNWSTNHPNVLYRLPSTARWKFLLDDEGTWHGCPTGCCTSPGGT